MLRCDIAKHLSTHTGKAISYTTVDSRIRNLGLVKERLEAGAKEVPKYNREIKLPMDDYLITVDYHSPYHSILWHNRSLAVAKKMKLKHLIIGGDLLDFGCASSYYADHIPSLEDEADANRDLIKSLIKSFDTITLIKGNHEDRLGRATNGIITARWLLELWGKDAMESGRMQYSTYDKLHIGEKWIVVHPKSYNRVSCQVAKQLAAKWQRNIINAHGHFVGYGYDVSGRNLAIDLGGIFDVDKIEYLNMKSTTHPAWNNGFGALKDGHFYLFDNNTDWSKWE